MNNDDILNIGDWIYEDGYGIVEKISPLYKRIIPRNMNLFSS